MIGPAIGRVAPAVLAIVLGPIAEPTLRQTLLQYETFTIFFDIAMRIVLPKGHSEPLFIPLYDIFL